MKQVFKSMTLAIAAAISLSSAALAASDAPADIRISHSDLDLTRPDDAATFKTRVAAAVNTWLLPSIRSISSMWGSASRVATIGSSASSKVPTQVLNARA